MLPLTSPLRPVRLTIGLLSLALLAATSPAVALAAPVPSAVAADPAAQRIDQLLSEHLRPDLPGATVIVTRGGKTLLRKAYGLASMEAKRPLQPDSLMLIGSITKQFTAVAILQLVEAGKLKLDDELQAVLPEWPAKGHKITIAHLLSHTSGIGNFFALPGFEQLAATPATEAQVFDFFKAAPLSAAPGQKWAYSNTGYFLLGQVIERVSGLSYADYMAQHVFRPLHMDHTAYAGKEDPRLDHAQGYGVGADGINKTAPFSVAIAYAAGALISNVDDLARWDQAVGTELISPASWAMALRTYKLSDGSDTGYGFGWMNMTVRGVAAQGHDGQIPGFNAFAVRIPEQQVYVAVLSNVAGMPLNAAYLGETVAAIAIGNPFPEYQAITLTAQQLDRFVGSYRIDAKENRVIRRDGQRMMMQRGSRAPVELFPFASDEFFIKGSPTRLHLRFEQDADGKVTHMTLVQNENRSVLPRLP